METFISSLYKGVSHNANAVWCCPPVSAPTPDKALFHIRQPSAVLNRLLRSYNFNNSPCPWNFNFGVGGGGGVGIVTTTPFLTGSRWLLTLHHQNARKGRCGRVSTGLRYISPGIDSTSCFYDRIVVVNLALPRQNGFPWVHRTPRVAKFMLHIQRACITIFQEVLRETSISALVRAVSTGARHSPEVAQRCLCAIHVG